jgi:hypothetical protein
VHFENSVVIVCSRLLAAAHRSTYCHHSRGASLIARFGRPLSRARCRATKSLRLVAI